MQEAGYCECGCGQRTTIAKYNSAQRGAVKGQPRRFVRGHGNRAKILYRERDLGYVTPCWIWRDGRHDTYGGIGVEGTYVAAHRYIYERERGPIPDSLFLDHLCRNPGCVNPDHLDPVTNAVNCRRGAKAKLTENDVREIRRRCASGEQQRPVAAAFGITQASVSLIVTRQQWADID